MGTGVWKVFSERDLGVVHRMYQSALCSRDYGFAWYTPCTNDAPFGCDGPRGGTPHVPIRPIFAGYGFVWYTPCTNNAPFRCDGPRGGTSYVPTTFVFNGGAHRVVQRVYRCPSFLPGEPARWYTACTNPPDVRAITALRGTPHVPVGA